MNIEEMADDLVAYYNTDDMSKMHIQSVDELRAAHWTPDNYSLGDLLDDPPTTQRILNLLRDAAKAKHSTSGYQFAAYALVDAMLVAAHAATDAAACRAVEAAYDRAHPEEGPESEDNAQRVRDWRALA